MLHALVEDFHGSSHRTHNPTSNDALRQFQMMEAEQMNALVKIQQTLSNLVQRKELRMAAVKVVYAEVSLLELLMESLPQPGTDVQERLRTLLKTEQVVGPQVAFVIGGPFAGQNRLT